MKGNSIPCLHCGRPFTPYHGNQRMHRACAEQRRTERYQSPHPKRRTRRPAPRPPALNVKLRPDFLLALPEMKAELVRQTGMLTMPVILPSDPLELTSFRVATERRGTGNGGQSA